MMKKINNFPYSLYSPNLKQSKYVLFIKILNVIISYDGIYIGTHLSHDEYNYND